MGMRMMPSRHHRGGGSSSSMSSRRSLQAIRKRQWHAWSAGGSCVVGGQSRTKSFEFLLQGGRLLCELDFGRSEVVDEVDRLVDNSCFRCALDVVLRYLTLLGLLFGRTV